MSIGPVKKILFHVSIFTITLFVMAIYPAGLAIAQSDTERGLVKVCLQQRVIQVAFSLEGQYRLIDTATGQLITDSREGRHWTVEKINDLLMVGQDGYNIGLYRGPVRVEEIGGEINTLAGNGTLRQGNLSNLSLIRDLNGDVHLMDDSHQSYYVINGQGELRPLGQNQLNLIELNKDGQTMRYRGGLEVTSTGEGITVVNVLPLEQYLYGVVPVEMPASFSIEALKAQAVIARSYLLSQMGSRPGVAFDVLDTQTHQVYGGYDRENSATTRAVEETRGLVLADHGQPVAAFYHASSGGYTENSEDVWLNFVPYIRSKQDPADYNNKHYHWQVNYSAIQLTDLINDRLKQYQQPDQSAEFSLITDLKELEYTSSGQRVKKLLIEGLGPDDQPVQVVIFNADRVRTILGLKSALFTLDKEMDLDGNLVSVTITGHGWGHGLGLSQWGAEGLAREGYSFQQILQYYYTDVDLIPHYGMSM